MSTKLLGVGAITIAFLIFILFAVNPLPSQNPSTNPSLPPTDSYDTDRVIIQSILGEYLEYSPDAYANAANRKRVLFFYASWCPTCRPADANFTANVAQIPQETTVLRVNYNDPDTDADEKELAQKYGVTYQHTFIQIDSEGNEVTRWNGGQMEELLENLK